MYSLAILLQEEGLLHCTLIYATDINPHALRAAESACSTRRRVAGVHREPCRAPAPAARCRTTHAAAYGRVVFDKGLREHMVFSDHSLATDSVFAEVHLVSCRNVLIYFERDLQNRALGCSASCCATWGSWALGLGVAAVFGAHRCVLMTSCCKTAFTARRPGL